MDELAESLSEQGYSRREVFTAIGRLTSQGEPSGVLLMLYYDSNGDFTESQRTLSDKVAFGTLELMDRKLQYEVYAYIDDMAPEVQESGIDWRKYKK